MCKKTSPSSWCDLKKGQKFMIVRNESGHNYPMNKVLTLKRDGNESTYEGTRLSDIAEGHCGNTVLISEIVLVSMSVEALKEQAAELDAKRNEILAKIRFCEENGSDEFDESEYEIFTALDILEGSGSRKEKAALLAKILNKK